MEPELERVVDKLGRHSPWPTSSFVGMNIYSLVPPSAGAPLQIHSFRSREHAVKARELYALADSQIVEVPLVATEFGLRELAASRSITVYFIMDEETLTQPQRAYTSWNEYNDVAHGLRVDHPFVDGALDGLRNSVEKASRLYNVLWFPKKEIYQCTCASELSAANILGSSTWTYDIERGKMGVNRGGNHADPTYFVYVHADDEDHAKRIASQLFKSYVEQEARRARPHYVL